MLGVLAALCAWSIVAYPEHAFQASLKGLRLWWDYVFPALLPFLIVTEMLLGLGVVHGLGVLLEPLLRRLFRLPGAAGWALAAGAVGGYPLGADASARLRRRGDLDQDATQRLVALSHLCNPMLMVGVIGAGFMQSHKAGLLLAVVHYASAGVAGWLSSTLGRKSCSDTAPPPLRPRGAGGRIFTRALRQADRARAEDGRTFGKLLGDAVSGSIQALLLIGGLMMIFSVLLHLAALHLGGGTAAAWLLLLLPGLAEPHLGAFAYSQLQQAAPALQAAAISACLGWSGLSVHTQALGLLKNTGVRYRPFLLFRLLHGLTAGLLALAAWNPLMGLLPAAGRSVFSPAEGRVRTPAEWADGWTLHEMTAMWGASFTLLALLLLFLLLLSCVFRLLDGGASRRRPR